MSSIFYPRMVSCTVVAFILTILAFARSNSRVFRSPNGDTRVVNFSLTQSRVSGKKRRRILYLMNTNSNFKNLNCNSWEDTEERRILGTAAASSEELVEVEVEGSVSISTESHEACWAVLQLMSMDSVYLKPTRYNLFLLIEHGNRFSALANVRCPVLLPCLVFS